MTKTTEIVQEQTMSAATEDAIVASCVVDSKAEDASDVPPADDKPELVEASETSVDSSDTESDEASAAPVPADETLVDVAASSKEPCVDETEHVPVVAEPPQTEPGRGIEAEAALEVADDPLTLTVHDASTEAEVFHGETESHEDTALAEEVEADVVPGPAVQDMTEPVDPEEAASAVAAAEEPVLVLAPAPSAVDKPEVLAAVEEIAAPEAPAVVEEPSAEEKEEPEAVEGDTPASPGVDMPKSDVVPALVPEVKHDVPAHEESPVPESSAAQTKEPQESKPSAEKPKSSSPSRAPTRRIAPFIGEMKKIFSSNGGTTTCFKAWKCVQPHTKETRYASRRYTNSRSDWRVKDE
jgi:hypothetical protein